MSDPVSYPNFGVAVVCKTCGETTYFPPSIAPRRRYCNDVCYAKRPPASPALAIIRLLGGSHKMADRLMISPRTVRAWSLNGIPTKYHFDIIEFAHECGRRKEVTYEHLRETVAFGRSWRRLGARVKDLVGLENLEDLED